MDYYSKTPEDKRNNRLASFARVYGEGHITTKTCDRLASGEWLEVFMAVELDKLVGFSVYGEGLSATVIRPDYRGKGLATILINMKTSKYPDNTAIVSLDNTASLQTMFKTGYIIKGYLYPHLVIMARN